MADINALLKKKVAGVPAIYIAGVAVGILAFAAWKLEPKSSGDPGADTAGTDAVDQSSDVASALDTSAYSTLSSNGTVTVSQPDGSTDSVDVVVETNDTWLTKGVAYLIAQGLASGGDAQEALSKYLNGAQLSYDEGKLRDTVIARYGLPPEPPTPGGTAQAPVKRQGNPPTIHTVQGTGDNTYDKLSQLYYGKADHDTVQLLQFANVKTLGHAGPWAKGTKVTIPAYSLPKYYTAVKGVTSASAIAAKNGITTVQLVEINDHMNFPVKIGTKVRVH